VSDPDAGRPPAALRASLKAAEPAIPAHGQGAIVVQHQRDGRGIFAESGSSGDAVSAVS
jgi:hypothetical protein